MESRNLRMLLLLRYHIFWHHLSGVAMRDTKFWSNSAAWVSDNLAAETE